MNIQMYYKQSNFNIDSCKTSLYNQCIDEVFFTLVLWDWQGVIDSERFNNMEGRDVFEERV